MTGDSLLSSGVFRALVKLEETLRLMTPKNSRPEDYAFATPRVLAPTIAQTAVCAVVARLFWTRWRSERRKEGHGDDAELTDFAHTVEWLRHNESISEGYRKQMLWCGCSASVGGLHNETFNIWSHLFAGLYFLNAFVLCRKRHARWQALAASYLFLMSAVAHAGFNRGPKWTAILFGIDRASIALYFYAVSIFLAKAHFSYRSLTVARLWAVACTFVSGASSFVLGGGSVEPWIGTVILISQMGFGAFPVFREYTRSSSVYFKTKVVKYLALSVVWGLVGALFYTSRFPEKRYPHRIWSYIGSSHNWMHVMVAVATFSAYRGSFLWEMELQRQGKLLRSLRPWAGKGWASDVF